MDLPNVQVCVVGGVADVRVSKQGVTVEVRDYDVDADDEELLWTDENGERCTRYIATAEEAEPASFERRTAPVESCNCRYQPQSERRSK